MDFGKRSREALKASWIPIEVKFPEHEQVVLISAQNRPDTMIATYREDTEGGAFTHRSVMQATQNMMSS